jgi:hypothetical protein
MPRDLETMVAEIRYHHRKRLFAMEQRKRADLALGSFLRTQLGWRKDGDDDANDFARKRAAELVAIGERMVKDCVKQPDKRRPNPGMNDADFQEWQPVIVAAVMSRTPFDQIEAESEKAMAKLAKELPVYEWASEIRGFGDVGLATIVAEAGDLSNYSNPAKLWKRMGVGLGQDGSGEWVRQGGLAKSAGAAVWIEHGYNRQRRSRMWNIGDALVKGNADGEFRTLFLERLAVEHAKAIGEGLIPATTTKATVESWEARDLPPLTKVSKLDAKLHRSAGHMTKRAQRYMEKRLLRNLWRAWREAVNRLEPTDLVPPAELIAAE